MTKETKTQPSEEWIAKCKDYTDRLYQMIGEDFEYKAFHKWMLNRTEQHAFFDPSLMYKCFRAEKRLKADHDVVWVIEGMEGTGKSTLAVQIASTILNQPPCLIYSRDQLVREMKKAAEYNAKGQRLPYALLIDEGGLLLFSRDGAKAEAKGIIKAMQMMRFLGVVTLFAIPNFYDIDGYIRKHRCTLCLSVLKRGEYKGITKEGIEYASLFARQIRNINRVTLRTGSFWLGTFRKQWPKMIDENEYNQLKRQNFEEFLEESKDSKEEAELEERKYVRATDVAKKLNISTERVSVRIKSGAIPGKKILGRYYVERNYYDGL